MFKELKELIGIWFGSTKPIEVKKYEPPWSKYDYLIEVINDKVDQDSRHSTIDLMRSVCEALVTILEWDECRVVGESLGTLYVYCGKDRSKQDLLVGVLSYYKPVGVGIEPLNEVY